MSASAENPVGQRKRKSIKSSEEEEEGSSDEEVELNLEFDENGRVGHWTGNVDFGFRTFVNAVQTTSKPLVIADCQAAFTARSTGKRGGYSYGETFWLPANAIPSNGLEQMAKDIFMFHTKNAKGVDEKTSGAEWWALVLDPEDAEVGFHWDKDYTVESDCGVNVFPHVSTVTYLSTIGAPTLILNKTAPVQYNDKFSGTADSVYISKPVDCKHISFDGRFLHGAPSDLLGIWNQNQTDSKSSSRQNKKRKKNTTPQEMRVTFLVNVWINHKPVGAVPFPSSVSMKSTSANAHVQLSAANETPPETFTVENDTTCKNWDKLIDKKPTKQPKDEGIEIKQWYFKQAKKHSIQVPLPVTKLVASSGHALFVKYNNKLKPEVS
eukprot:Phypoly_transcript_11275.p1 GENE.Phypoly_transcript_11275~~Phypoly_transcript_11275.p1  ORF type:complete len:397 (+),score=49.50 Phypoly_transcript_11275:54-1193(+)